MSKLIDLTGKRFGALVALRPVSAADTADHRPGWLVRCDCGREKIVNGSNLRQGRITSCGCTPKKGDRIAAALLSNGPAEDLTGKTIYHLTAIAYVGHNYWRWRCDCGRETEAKAADVKTGNVQSCGHVLSQVARKKIIVENTVEHYDGTTVSRLRHIMASPEVKGIRARQDAKGRTYYQARLTLRHKTIYLGTFYSRDDAEKARRRAEEQYYLPIIHAYDQSITHDDNGGQDDDENGRN